VKLIWQTPDGDTESLEIEQESYSLGRGETADIHIADENASREHARLHYDASANSLSVEDLGSRNGVYVNGQRIEGQVPLQAEDTLLIGATTLAMQVDATAENGIDPNRTRAMALEDIAALIDSPRGSAEEEDNTREMDIDATMAMDADDIDATELFNAASIQNPAPMYKLVVIDGELYGEEYALDATPLVIGRKADCGIILQGGAVSGHHAQVRLDGDRALLADLGSKNGTFISDNPIAVETQLSIGTAFSVGGTSFKLLGGDTFVSVAKPPSKNQGRKKLLAVAALVLTLVVMAGGKLILEKKHSQPPVAPSVSSSQTKAPGTGDGLEPLQPLAPTAALPPHTTNTAPLAKTSATGSYSAVGAEDRSVAIFRETASAFMENRLWQEAIDRLEAIQDRAPQTDGVDALLTQAAFERTNQQHFDKGLSLAARKQFQEAKTAFTAIAENSVYHDEALLELQNVENAIQQAARISTSTQPSKSAPSPAKSKPVAKPKPAVTAESIARRSLENAKRDYLRGDIKAARDKVAAAKASKLSANHQLKRQAKNLDQQLQKAEAGFVLGEKHLKAKDLTAALKIWAEVLAIDSTIAGNSESAYSRRIAATMADYFYAEAREAYRTENWAVARSNALKTIKAKPNHQAARLLLSDLNKRAKKLYEEGYILEDLNPEKATERWRQVLQVGSPDNEYYRKAREKLAKYGG
jgi:ABC transport system ATP-binding/permease protein